MEAAARSPDFNRGFIWSVTLHVIAAAALLIKAIVFPGKPILIPPTLRVDIVGLPDLLKKDLANVSKQSTLNDALKKAANDAAKIKPKVLAPAPPVEEAKHDEMVLKPQSRADEHARQKKLKSALDRIKALAKINAEERKAASPLIKGNRVSKGTSLSGEARESAQVNYYDSLRDSLQEHWELPIWLSRQNYSAQIQVFIDSQGKLREFRFIKSSGNAKFDDAVKRTLTVSQPFPIPPAELVGALLGDGVLVGFPL